MKAHSWLGRLFGRSRRSTRRMVARRPNQAHPWPEELEARCIPSFATLASFDGANGANPRSLIVDSAGNLYGTTYAGGPSDDGTVFEILNGSNIITTLASFNGTNGANPEGGLVVDKSGNLFGATYAGGSFDAGTVFEVQHDSGTITTLASFDGTNGKNPSGGVVADSSGNLYGTTSYGGPGYVAGTGLLGAGVVFEVLNGSGVITPIAFFNGANGTEPNGLTLDANGNLFGTGVAGGGDSTYGTVFKVAKGSGQINVLGYCNYTVGINPSCVSLVDSSGNLFGSATSGGTANIGTVFEFRNSSGTLSPLASFIGSNGWDPTGTVVQDSAGNLFGTTVFGGPDFGTASGNGDGTIFTLRRGSATVDTLVAFSGTNGVNPFAGLVEDSSGNLYGTTNAGGPSGSGTVFEVQLQNPIITTWRLPDWTLDHPVYSQVITAFTHSASVTFTQTDGTLPTGLSLSSTGLLSGTPTVSGTYTFTVTATDNTGLTGKQSFTVTINPLLSIATPTLTNWTVNLYYYSQSIYTAGGTGSKQGQLQLSGCSR
jgi:uncharacterized repeat protein (TIGR03803 family)